MDPYTIYRLSVIRHKEIVNLYEQTWGDAAPQPQRVSLIAQLDNLWVGVRMRLQALRIAYPTPTESAPLPAAEAARECTC